MIMIIHMVIAMNITAMITSIMPMITISIMSISIIHTSIMLMGAIVTLITSMVLIPILMKFQQTPTGETC